MKICNGVCALVTYSLQGNILVSDNGEACIADFGLSRWISHTKSPTEQRPPPGKVRYMAPELLGIALRGSEEPEEPEEHSTKSDIYAFAMVTLEVSFAVA